jgi:hypothetical protein
LKYVKGYENLNLQIGRTGVEVKVDGGLANLDRGDVLLVTADRLVGGRARLTTSGSRGNVGRDGATVLLESTSVGSRTVGRGGLLDSDLVKAELGSSGRVVGSGLGGGGQGQGRDNSLCVNHFECGTRVLFLNERKRESELMDEEKKTERTVKEVSYILFSATPQDRSKRLIGR